MGRVTEIIDCATERKIMTDKHFIDWESNTFGYGYGTGEIHTILVLKKFFINLPKDGQYNYEKMEEALGAEQFWLLLNILCHADIIDYGTSPRYGWLSDKGQILREYVDSKSATDLYELTSVDQEYVHCYPDHCNCETKCKNPLFGSHNEY